MRAPSIISTPTVHAPGARRRVIAFANQKGGVAKTTTTLNLGVALHEMGHRVLLVDLDPQGNLTMSQGMNPDAIEKSMFDVLVHRIPISDVIATVEVDVAVSSIDLAGAELALSSLIGRERALEKALLEVRDQYDYVLIDTPPSLGLLTINAFVAATGVIVPVQCEYLSLRGLVQLENTLAMVRENLNPSVGVEGHRRHDVRRPHAALPRGDRDPRGELRRPRLRHPDPQDGAVRGGAGEGQLGAQVRARPGPPRRPTASWLASSSRRRCRMARKRASMREGPLAELFRATEAAQRGQPSRHAGGAPAVASGGRARSAVLSTDRAGRAADDRRSRRSPRHRT